MKKYLNKIKNFIYLKIEKHQQEKRMLAFYKTIINVGDLCFDVGANIGNRTEVFLKLKSKVVAVEPQKRCFDILNKKFSKNKNVKLVNKALGAHDGEEEIMIAGATTVSSISKKWIESVKKSGRFGDMAWEKGYKVEVTTLDSLILTYGTPVFCKIDVEGFEFEVLSGLSKPIKLISFEFTPELIESAVSCINHLSQIGKYEFSYSLGESMELNIKYINGDEIQKILLDFKDSQTFGDVYARLI